MPDKPPKQTSVADAMAKQLSPALCRLTELEATDLATRSLTKAEMAKLADDLLMLARESPSE